MLLNRRKLLALSLGSAALLPLSLSGLVGSQSVTRCSWALGSEVSMTVVGLSNQRALDAAFQEIELVEQVMSLYRIPHTSEYAPPPSLPRWKRAFALRV